MDRNGFGSKLVLKLVFEPNPIMKTILFSRINLQFRPCKKMALKLTNRTDYEDVKNWFTFSKCGLLLV